MIKDIKSLMINLSPLAAIYTGKGLANIMRGNYNLGLLEVIVSLSVLSYMFYLIFKVKND